MTPGMGNELARAIRSHFSAAVRRRGDRCLARGAVHVQHIDPLTIRARVTGTRRYAVCFNWAGREIVAYCDCPYFRDVGPCKHLWAVALAYQANGMVPAGLASKRLVSAEDESDVDLSACELDEEDDLLDDGDDEADDEADDYGLTLPDLGPFQVPLGRPPRREGRRPPSWRKLLAELHERSSLEQRASARDLQSPGGRLLYVIDVPTTLARGQLAVNVLRQTRKKNGEWGVGKPQAVSRLQVSGFADPADQQIGSVLLGACPGSFAYYGFDPRGSSFVVDDVLSRTVLPLLCASGRCRLARNPQDDGPPLTLDEGPAWQFRVAAEVDTTGQQFVLSGSLHRDDVVVDLAEPVLLLGSGWVFWPDRVARLEHQGAFMWIALLRREKQVRVPVRQAHQLLESLLRIPALPPMDLPAELSYETVRVSPRPCLHIRRPTRSWGRQMLEAELAFDYDGQRIASSSAETGIYLRQARRLILRDRAVEAAALEKLNALGVQRRNNYDGTLTLAPRHLPRVVTALIAENWEVQADGSVYRRAGRFELSVCSGIDWFELRGQADFDGASAPLPRLLAALNKGESFVRLDDGSLGVLPEQWLRKFGLLASVGTTQEDHLRFKPTQAGFLDALLAAQPDATCDETFARAREHLRRFERIEPADPPPGFSGTLRPYQRDGLGWLHFLQRFGFGGCLADDMGLGKTVQVLAMLESRRQMRADGSSGGDRPGPSLAVVPRSLVFNWRQEAERFTPELRVLEHTGTGRTRDARRLPAHFDDYDLVLTTYGTLRRDAGALKDMAFDYLVFDESQAIKNANTASAKAARLLQGRHRLCLSGTPIENHLGELWSQFEVLNPGMLGASPPLAAGTTGNGGPDEPTRQLLARALRPFILRRSKAQVATDLPDKTEQTLYCELATAQRKLYNELRDHYRRALLARVRRDGMNKVKLQVLEALLRLRQAAIHPGLIDRARDGESSAKLGTLLPQLQEVTDEGHKALVFSQFTTMLAILRDRLDKAGIAYEYLDGQTRDRQARVDRFQNDPQRQLFLISLKAGGLGLNLTAAEYVFLLDPWWNPAVEAQAVDRAHRIGQSRQVFAYRLIARDTVEERIL